MMLRNFYFDEGLKTPVRIPQGGVAVCRANAQRRQKKLLGTIRHGKGSVIERINNAFESKYNIGVHYYERYAIPTIL